MSIFIKLNLSLENSSHLKYILFKNIIDILINYTNIKILIVYTNHSFSLEFNFCEKFNN